MLIGGLTEAVQAAAAGVVGVAIVGDDYRPTCPVTDAGVRAGKRVMVQWSATPTAAAEASVRAAVAAFNWTPRRLKSRSALIVEIAALTVADRNKLLAAMAADWLRENPKRAKAVGVNLDGDEEAV